MKTKAAPGVSGRRSRSSVNASKPPAEAPNPATGHGCAAVAGGGSAAATGFALLVVALGAVAGFGLAFGLGSDFVAGLAFGLALWEGRIFSERVALYFIQP